jgi:hypothetical protein
MLAAVRVLAFASYLGASRTVATRRGVLVQHEVHIISAERAEQEPADPVASAIDFVKTPEGDCSYDRRDFVPMADNRTFARGTSGAMPVDHYVIWHTRVDFSRLSNEWDSDGTFLHLRGGAGALCAFETRIMSHELADARGVTPRQQQPTPGTSMRCGSMIGGPARDGLMLQILRAVEYIHAHVCPPYQMPF